MGVIYKIDEAIAIVALNRPEAMNAIDPETAGELRTCWSRIQQDSSLRCVILTGTGARAFCTGSDLKKTMPPPQGIAELTFGADKTPHLLEGMDEIEIPIICAINGYAIGGGLEMALACDIRIASSTARFGLPEVCIGSLPGGGGTQRLPRIIGLSNAMELLLTGELVDAAEALRIGLVSKVVEPDGLLELAFNIAGRIAGNAPLSVRAIKSLVGDGLDMPLKQAIKQEFLSFGVLRDSKDRLEGRLAFQQKRKAVFDGT